MQCRTILACVQVNYVRVTTAHSTIRHVYSFLTPNFVVLFLSLGLHPKQLLNRGSQSANLTNNLQQLGNGARYDAS